MPTTFDPELVLHRPLMAFVATTDAQGAPCNAPMWFIWEDDAIWLLGSNGNSTLGRLSKNPQCAIEIVHYENAPGVLMHLGLRGSATIETMNPDRFRRLLDKYLGARETWNPWFIENIARIDDPEGRLIKLVPDSIFTNNVSYFRSGPDLTVPTD